MHPINPFSYVRPVRTARGITALLGRWTLTTVATVGELGTLLRDVVRALMHDRQRRSVIVIQLYHIGYLSLPVVLLTGTSIAMVMAVQSFTTLASFNAEVMAGPMVNYAMVTQLAPVVTGLMLAGRVGSNMAAEIGTMKVTEQLDALRVMGTDPVAYLVAPRFLACVLLMPLLTALGAAAGMAAAAILVTGVWRVDAGAYWSRSNDYVGAWDILTGLGKTLIFGGILALVACRRGLQTRGGATGVGEACTQGVVQASVLVLIANFMLTLMLQKIWTVLFGD
ncbi:MAG TPA: ABC transporter permease [Planctomycetota bacterium]|nr:ABC transporter permease [Planctomycetota bacterium]